MFWTFFLTKATTTTTLMGFYTIENNLVVSITAKNRYGYLNKKRNINLGGQKDISFIVIGDWGTRGSKQKKVRKPGILK